MMLRPELTIAWLTVRQLLALRRGVAVLLFAALPALVATPFQLRVGADAVPFLLDLYQEFFIRILLPVVALVFGTGAFGAEREEGTAVYLLTKPLPRWRIALAKLVTVALLSATLVTVSACATGLVAFRGAGPNRITLAFTAAAALGAVLYCFLFLALSLFVRRAMIVGLVYVILWEGFAADTFAGTRTLSVRQYVLAAADRITNVDPALFTAALAANTALVMSAALLITTALLSIRRLQSFELTDQQ